MDKKIPVTIGLWIIVLVLLFGFTQTEYISENNIKIENTNRFVCVEQDCKTVYVNGTTYEDVYDIQYDNGTLYLYQRHINFASELILMFAFFVGILSIIITAMCIIYYVKGWE